MTFQNKKTKLMKHSIFSRQSNSDIDFDGIYRNLKTLEKNAIKEQIDLNTRKYGLYFLDRMIFNTLLDIENKNVNISIIEKYATYLINKLNKKDSLSNILKTWPGYLVTIASIGTFVLEIIKFIIENLPSSKFFTIKAADCNDYSN